MVYRSREDWKILKVGNVAGQAQYGYVHDGYILVMIRRKVSSPVHVATPDSTADRAAST